MIDYIIYTSQATDRFQPSDLAKILLVARQNNQMFGICGALLYQDDRFLQILEGEREAIDMLLDSIKQDPRHHDLAIINQGQKAGPQFTEWAMAEVSDTRASESPTIVECLREDNISDETAAALTAEIQKICI